MLKSWIFADVYLVGDLKELYNVASTIENVFLKESSLNNFSRKCIIYLIF